MEQKIYLNNPTLISEDSDLARSLGMLRNDLRIDPAERLLFYANPFEAMSHLFFSVYVDIVRQTGKTHLLTSCVEERPILSALQELEQVGCVTKKVAVTAEGQLTQELLEEAIRPRTALVSISWANPLTGVIQPVQELARVCREKEVLFHVDATYMLGKSFVCFSDLDADILSFSGYGLHASSFTTVITRAETPLLSYRQRGEENAVSEISVLARETHHAMSYFDHFWTETVRLRNKFEQELLSALPEVQVLFQTAPRLPSCSAMIFPGISSEMLLFALYRKGVFATLGGDRLQLLKDHLIQTGIDRVAAHAALSFSLSHDTTEEQIDRAIQVIVEEVTKLRVLSLGLE